MPEGPAAEAVRAWFLGQKASGCRTASANGQRCSLGPATTFDVRYHPNGDSALVFVAHAAADGSVVPGFPGMDVAVFREASRGWEWVRNAEPVAGLEIRHLWFEANTAYYSSCPAGWREHRCLPAARYHDLDLGR